MKLPICTFDAKTGLLCAVCQAKVADGKLGEADLEVSKALLSVSSRFKALESVSLARGHKVDGEYLLEVAEPGLSLLREREVRAELGRILGGRVWTAAASASSRGLIEDILYPAKVVSFGTVWLPDGSSMTKVVVEDPGRRFSRRLEVAQKLLKEARGIDLVIEIEVNGGGAPAHTSSRPVGVPAQHRYGHSDDLKRVIAAR